MKTLHLAQAYFLLILVSCATAARILAIIPYAFRSHQNFHQAVLRSLAQAGHQVVVYGPFPQKTPVPNYEDVFVNTSYTDDWVTYDLVLDIFHLSPTEGMQMLWQNMNTFLQDALSHENIQKLAKSDEKFDLVITETFMAQEAFLAFGHKFNAPVISLQPMNTFGLINKAMGNSLALSYIPDFNLGFSDKMTLYERLVNSYATFKMIYQYHYEELPLQQEFLKHHLDFLNTPPLEELLHNISLVFVNGHPTSRYAQPFTPNIIPLGGIHIPTERKPLPQGIQIFMDGAPHGVIYFSFGTCVPEHRLPADLNQIFVRVFKRLKQRVLWKTRAADNITGLSENVMTVKWAPQQEILAHPNCVLFLTHGGLLSQLEVSYAGVPVVGVPFFADQPMNVRYYESKGVGVKLDFFELTEENIFRTLNKVLENPRYKENAEVMSRVFRDLPMTQAESAVFWVEYVLRHKGAQHLRPAAARLPWYQLALLDVIFATLIVAALFCVLAYLIFRRVIKWWRTSTGKKTNLSKKRN